MSSLFEAFLFLVDFFFNFGENFDSRFSRRVKIEFVNIYQQALGFDIWFTDVGGEEEAQVDGNVNEKIIQTNPNLRV